MIEQPQNTLLPLETTLEFNGKSLFIQKVIGQGADGQVYKGLLKQSGQSEIFVAIKASLRGDQAADLYKQDAFTTQIETIETLNARCLENGKEPVAPRYYGRSMYDKVPFFVMELIQGTQLFQEEYGQVKRQPSEGQTLAAFTTFFESLSFLHSAGIILADMKLENLFWEGNLDKNAMEGRLRIIDLGTTLKLDETATGPGNPAFDVLRASVMLCRVLTGYSPVIDQMTVKSNIITLLEGAGGRISWGTKLLLRKLLNKTPASRPASAEEAAKFVGDLSSIWAKSDDVLYESIYKDETKLRSIPENATEDSIRTERKISNRARSSISILQLRSPQFNPEQISAYLDSVQQHLDRRDDLRIGLIFLEAYNFASAIRSFVNGSENSFSTSQSIFRRLIYISLAALQQTDLSVREKIGADGLQAVLLLNDNNLTSALTRLMTLRDTVGNNALIEALIAESRILANIKEMEAFELKGDLVSAISQISEARQLLKNIPLRSELDGYFPEFAGRISDRADFEAFEIGFLQEKEDALHKRSGAGEQKAFKAKKLANEGNLEEALSLCFDAFNVSPENPTLQDALRIYCNKALERRDFASIQNSNIRMILNYYSTASGFSGVVALFENLTEAGKKIDNSDVDGTLSRLRKTIGWQARWPEIVRIWNELLEELVKKIRLNSDDIGLEKTIDFINEIPEIDRPSWSVELPDVLKSLREKKMLRYAPEIDQVFADVEMLLSGNGLPAGSTKKDEAILLTSNREAALNKANELLDSIYLRIKTSHYKQDLWKEKQDFCKNELEEFHAEKLRLKQLGDKQESTLWNNCQNAVTIVRQRAAEKEENPGILKIEQTLLDEAGSAYRSLFQYKAQFGNTFSRDIDNQLNYVQEILDRYGRYGWEAASSAIDAKKVEFKSREDDVVRDFQNGKILEACAGYTALYGNNIQNEQARELWNALETATKLKNYSIQNKNYLESGNFDLKLIQAANSYLRLEIPSIYKEPFTQYISNVEQSIRNSISSSIRYPRQRTFFEDIRNWIDLKSAKLNQIESTGSTGIVDPTKTRDFLQNVILCSRKKDIPSLERAIDRYAASGGTGSNLSQSMLSTVLSEEDGKEHNAKIIKTAVWVGGSIVLLLVLALVGFVSWPTISSIINPPTPTFTATSTTTPTKKPAATKTPLPTPTIPLPTSTPIINVSTYFKGDGREISPALPVVSSQVWVLDSTSVISNPPIDDQTTWIPSTIKRQNGKQEQVFSSADTKATVDWVMDTPMNQSGKFAVFVFDPAQAPSGGSWKYTFLINGQSVNPTSGNPVITLNSKNDYVKEDAWILAGIYDISIGQKIQIHTEFAGEEGNNSLPVGNVVLIKLTDSDVKSLSEFPKGRELTALFDTNTMKYFMNNAPSTQGWKVENDPSKGSSYIWVPADQTVENRIVLTTGGKIAAGDYEMIVCVPVEHAQAAVTFDILEDGQKLPNESPRVINQSVDAGKCVSAGLWNVPIPGSLSVQASIPPKSAEAAIDLVALFKKSGMPQ